MVLHFAHSVQSEWLKIKRSLALWIVVTGAFFVPVIVIATRITHYKDLPALYASPNFWPALWHSLWESMAVFLLPLGIILATALVAQIEYKNNAWKQLHTLPVTLSTIFFSKLSVILVMLIAFFALFNTGIFLTAIIPYLVVPGVPYPTGRIPYTDFAHQNIEYIIVCLPIVALQYLMSLKYKNFLIPVGIGFLLWVSALASLSWEYGYLMPYTYCMFTYIKTGSSAKATVPTADLRILALLYFIVITTISYILFLTKKEKG